MRILLARLEVRQTPIKPTKSLPGPVTWPSPGRCSTSSVSRQADHAVPEGSHPAAERPRPNWTASGFDL